LRVSRNFPFFGGPAEGAGARNVQFRY
jgi:hypothetical protein